MKAIQDAMQLTSGELEEKLEANQQAIQEAVNDVPEIVVRDVTEEERQALQYGTLTEEELADRLTQPNRQSDQQTGSGTKESAADPEQRPVSPMEPSPSVQRPEFEEEAYQKELSAIIAKIYVMRVEYGIALDSMFEAAKTEYVALPEDQRTKSNLAKMAVAYLGKATALEKECDGKMMAVVEEMQKLIEENNGDLDLIDTVLSTYTNEKRLKKSWYMSKLEEKGLL